MEKKTLYALVALVALVLLSVVTLRSPDKGDRVGDKPRPIAEIGAGAIATLEIGQPGGTDKVTISKKGDKWQVTAPYDKPADNAAVKQVAEALEKLKWGDITTQQKDRHAELEVGADKAVHVIAKDSAGKVLADLYIGKSAGAATMVRIEGKDEVWQAQDLSPFTFKKDGKQWREHAIFDDKADDAEKVAILGGGASVYLERLPPPKGEGGKEAQQGIYDAKWKVVAPPQPDDKALKPDPGTTVDDGVVNGIAQGLASLRAGEFLDSAKPEELGLSPGAPGQLELRVSYKGGKTAGVRIGLLKGEDYHVQTLASPQIFSAKKFSLERLAHLPQDVRDKTVTQLKEDQLEQVTVQQGADVLVLKRGADGKWKADKVAETDEEKAKGVADSFGTLSGFGFVAPGTKELASLAAPKATVTLKPKGAAAVVLKIGETRGEELIVQKVGQEPLWMKKYNADRFLKKPADVTKEKK